MKKSFYVSFTCSRLLFSTMYIFHNISDIRKVKLHMTHLKVGKKTSSEIILSKDFYWFHAMLCRVEMYPNLSNGMKWKLTLYKFWVHFYVEIYDM